MKQKPCSTSRGLPSCILRFDCAQPASKHAGNTTVSNPRERMAPSSAEHPRIPDGSDASEPRSPLFSPDGKYRLLRPRIHHELESARRLIPVNGRHDENAVSRYPPLVDLVHPVVRLPESVIRIARAR